MSPDTSSSSARARWSAAVGTVLARQRGVDRDELGERPERLLDTTTYDGITLSALYSAADERPERALPGRSPFVRGARPAGSARGWDVRAAYGAADAAVVNRQILHDLQHGVTALTVEIGDGALPVDGLGTALEGVLLDVAPVLLRARSSQALPAARTFLDLLDRSEVTDASQVRACLGLDPYGAAARTGTPSDLAAATTLAAEVTAHPGQISTFLVDGEVFHDAGGSDAQELGAALTGAVGYVRALVDAGVSPADAMAQVEFAVAVSDEQFATIAKLRAGRLLWARVAEVLAVPAAGARQHAVTSTAMMSARDPWVNMLRTTVAAFGAGVGGATSVTVQPFDAVVPGGVRAVSASFAARIARNSQLVLLEEAHLDAVADPAGGSWYVEQLTDRLAQAAWAFFQELEAAGGLGVALRDGLLAERLAQTREQRTADTAHRRRPLTGVSEFPDLQEPPLTAAQASDPGAALPNVRYDAAYEALRARSDAYLVQHGARPAAFVASLGPPAQHAARMSFVANLLAAGGIASVTSAQLDSAAEAGGTLAASGLAVAVLCGSAAVYDKQGAATVTALRDNGARRVLVAGTERDFPAGSAPDGFVSAGVDAVAVLGALLDVLTEAPLDHVGAPA